MKFEIIIKIHEKPLKLISLYTHYKQAQWADASMEGNKAREMELKI